MTDFSPFAADPLYLRALASLSTGLPPKLVAEPLSSSIAVLPFVNISGEAGQEHFTDGLTEDIITDLSNVPGFLVIARNSTFAYKGKPTDVRQIAHDLGVRYILEGSARRSDKRLRINVQLIAAEGGNHVWAERFDREMLDVFAVQDEVTRRVVEAIAGKLTAGMVNDTYRPSSLEAYDLCVKSRRLWNLSTAATEEAIQKLTYAISLDSNYCEAQWSLGYAHAFAWIIWGEPKELHRDKAFVHIERSIALDPNNSDAHRVYGFILLNTGQENRAKREFEAAIALNPNNADALMSFSDYYVTMGDGATALELAARAMRLNPSPPGWYYWQVGVAQAISGQYEAALETLRRTETYGSGSDLALIAILAMLGRTDDAREEARRFISDNPNVRLNAINVFKDNELMARWNEALIAAGISG